MKHAFPVPGLHAGDREERKCFLEGETLTLTCPYNIMLYSSSLKAWQRVRSRGPPETLVLTNTRNADFNMARAGRYLLEDYPTESVVKVTVTGLQRQDVGLYQCVVYLSPDNVVLLYQRIRLAWCQGELRWRFRWSLSLLSSGWAHLPGGAALRRQLRVMRRILDLSFFHSVTPGKSHSLCPNFFFFLSVRQRH